MRPDTAIILFVLVFVGFRYFQSGNQEPQKQLATPKISDNDEIRRDVGEIHKCILDELEEEEDPQMFIDRIREVTGDCLQQIKLPYKINEYKNEEEIKYHIKNSKAQEVVVSVGIGKDIKAEKALLEDSPSSVLFFGADPVYEENDHIYSKIGVYFPFAIGAKNTLTTVKIFKEGTYKDEEGAQISLISLLSDFIRRSTIDSVWYDGEGKEYEIMDNLHEGAALDTNGITVCQWNLEFHALNDERRQKIREFLIRIMKEMKYGLLRLSHSNEIRLYLLNISSDYCRTRFIQQFYDLSSTS